MKKNEIKFQSPLNASVLLFLFFVGFVAVIIAMANGTNAKNEADCKAHCTFVGLNFTAAFYPKTCLCEVNTAIFRFSKDYDSSCIRKLNDWYQCGVQQMAVIG
jgi:hypothetical protein